MDQYAKDSNGMTEWNQISKSDTIKISTIFMKMNRNIPLLSNFPELVTHIEANLHNWGYSSYSEFLNHSYSKLRKKSMMHHPRLKFQIQQTFIVDQLRKLQKINNNEFWNFHIVGYLTTFIQETKRFPDLKGNGILIDYIMSYLHENRKRVEMKEIFSEVLMEIGKKNVVSTNVVNKLTIKLAKNSVKNLNKTIQVEQDRYFDVVKEIIVKTANYFLDCQTFPKSVTEDINKILSEYNHLGPIWGFNSWNILRAEAIDLIDFAVDEGEIKMPESHSMEILKRNG